MSTQLTYKTQFEKIGNYYLIPHELLHVFAYRLLRKPCHYVFGERQVHSPAVLSRGERLFVLLLPVTVFLLGSLLFHLTWIILALSARKPLDEYLISAPWWHFVFHALANLCLLYCGTAYRDIRRVVYLLFNKQPQ